MKIYSINFYTTIQIDEEGRVLAEGVDEDQAIRKRLDEKFELGAESVGEAFELAMEFLDDQLGEDEYDIASVKLLEDLHILNWPGDGEPCQCPYCRTERAPEEDRLKFIHTCGQEITIVSDGWETMICPRCGKEILRDRIVGTYGNYIFMDIDK